VHAVSTGDADARVVQRAALFAIFGFGAVYAVMFVWARFDLVTTVRAIAAEAVRFNARVHRPYGPWVARNLVDLAFGAGICQTTLFCWAFARGVRGLRGGDGRFGGRAAALTIGIAASIGAANLAGINRGEVVRLWIFFACFMAVPAAVACARLNSRLALVLVLATTVLQTALSTSMIAFAQP